MLGPGEVTVKSTPLLETPETVTTTLPLVAPLGTGITMLVAVQPVAVPAEIPLKVTVLEPWLPPKLVPAIVTEVPMGPDVGLRPVMLGAGITVKVTPLLGTPPTVTTTGPVVAPAGTGTMMLVGLQFETVVAGVPLNVTVLDPTDEPKLVPVMVTDVPTAPDVGLKFVMVGPAPPPPPAALKDANTAPQTSAALSDALADATPALPWI
jgi:hypothetical protein